MTAQLDQGVAVRSPDTDGLLAWAERTGRRPAAAPGRGRLRFAFYGRVSTEDYQDPVTSRARQCDQAGALVAAHGQIVAEFFDIGQSRTLAWARRPQAAALVAGLADPDRGWDAVVIGEYERAFYGSQFASMAPLFEHYGIQLWTPETGGRVDFSAEDHEQTMLALGLQSKREITRTRIRVRTAMAAQTREQGRYLGGLLLYGYRLADAGPHPNKAHAAWGRRAHRLDPDPRRRRRCGGSSRSGWSGTAWPGSPAPSTTPRSPARQQRTRSATRTAAAPAWKVNTVAAILGNPRYTGRQVWNRQRTDLDLVDPANTSLGHRPVAAVEPARGLGHLRPPRPPGARQRGRLHRRPGRWRAAAARPARRPAGTCWPGCCAAGPAGGAWNRPGRTAGPPTGAVTVTPVPPAPTPPGRKNAYVREDQILPHLAPGHPAAPQGQAAREQAIAGAPRPAGQRN